MGLRAYIVAVLITSLLTGLLSTFVINTESQFGLSYNNITEGTPAETTLNQTLIYSSIRNQTLEAGTFGPGQPNAVPIDNSNPTGSIQKSGLASALKMIYIALSSPSILIQAFGTFIGIDGQVLDFIAVVLNISILLLIASIPFFRSFV